MTTTTEADYVATRAHLARVRDELASALDRLGGPLRSVRNKVLSRSVRDNRAARRLIARALRAVDDGLAEVDEILTSPPIQRG